MVRFSDRSKSIRPTGVRRMFDMAGDDAVQFGLGEPDFQPPELAVEAFARAMREGRNKYTTTAGLPPQLRGVLEDLLDLEGSEVGVRLHDQGDDAADRGGRVRSAAPPSCVCVLRGVTAEEVVARATGDAGLGLDYVGPGGADLRDQLVEGVAVPVVLARPPGSCLLYTSPSPRDATLSRMPSSA